MIQEQVINKILDSKDASIITKNSLSSEYFSDYKSEFAFITEHLNQYGNIPDKATFINRFPDFTVLEVTESDKYLLDALNLDRNTRILTANYSKIRDLLNQGKQAEAIELAQRCDEESSLFQKHVECIDITKDTSRYDAYVERCNDFNKYYISTGFKELDTVIGGWDRQEELATLVARSNQGKSWILLKFAEAAAKQGLTVGLYSGEMSERKVGYRLDTLNGHIDNKALVHGNPDIQYDYKKYIDSMQNRFKSPIKVLTPVMLGKPAGVSDLRAFIENENIDVLFVDQHSLLEDDRHAKNPVEKAANISRDLKNLQVLKKIPIISASQQNRTSTENGVGLEHVAQSDRIAQDSTIVLFFEQKDGLLTLNLVKSRDSENGKKLTYAIDFNKGLFQYMPEENNAANGAGCKELEERFEDVGTDEY